MPTLRGVAALLGALVVVLGSSGCSGGAAESLGPAESSTSARSAPPSADAAPASVAAWIAAGRPADPADYRTVERDGGTTRLAADEVAFRLPGPIGPADAAGCIRRWTPTLSCLPELADAPERPDGLAGHWIPNWVDFDGSMISVAAVRGDPGVFNNGTGRVLPYGASLRFGDYQCRSDPSGLYCISLSRRSGMLLADTVTAFGCTRQATPPYGIGQQFYCT